MRNRVRELVLLLLLLASGCGYNRAARLLEDAVRPATELTEGVEEEEARIAGIRVRLYRQADAAAKPPAILLCPGAVVDGIDDARFVALARALTRQGFEVATPDLPSLRVFRIDGEDPARIADIARQFAGSRRVTLAGISIGGSYCLVAAARPDMTDKVACVFSFGGYADLAGLLELWMTAPKPDVPGLLNPLREGRQLLLKGNRERLDPDAYAAAMQSTEPASAAEARRLLAPLQTELKRLTPAASGRVPRCPVFLLHGLEDPIVPATDAAALSSNLRARGARVRVLVTDLFSHVDSDGGRPSPLRALPMLRFIAAFLRVADS